MSPLSREEIAKLEIGQTDIAPWLARTMTIVFLALIFAVPFAHELAHPREQQQNPPSTWPRCASIFTTLPEVAAAFDRADGNLWRRSLTANHRLLKNIDLYEASLKDESQLVERLLGPTQHTLTKWGGLGNEKAYLGRDGWLFYRASVDYVTGPAFLNPRVLAKRAQSGRAYAAPLQPDPRPAIVQFSQDLRRRGIALIIVPVPGKPTIHPERLASRYSASAEVLQNESFDRFREDIEGEGVIVFDPAPLLRGRKKRTGKPQFLQTDTHWTCDAAQAVAEALAEQIEGRSLLPARPPTSYETRSATVSNLGDIAAMLRLPDDQTLFPPQAVEIRQVLESDGALWQPDQAADVLLLGDSFTNIFSQANMNWGESAGLAEQLSLVLQRPLDRISQNDSGAFATRQTLTRELARGHDRLAGKRLVIWEFAARELAVGDWKLLPLPPGERRRAGAKLPLPPGEGRGEGDLKRSRINHMNARPKHGATLPHPSPLPEGEGTKSRSLPAREGMVVRGQIEATAGVPKPGSVPYRDAVTSLHLSGVEAIDGAAPAKQIVVYVLGMRDNRWTAAARYKPGDKVTLRLWPWSKVSGKYGSLTRIELDDPDFTLIELPLFWAEENRPLE